MNDPAPREPVADEPAPIVAANAESFRARLLPREEYIEQAYFFRMFRERLADAFPTQDVLEIVGQEILATTKLPLAIDFLRGEVHHNVPVHEAMAKLPHYFRPFQSFVMARADADKSRFEPKTALHVLQNEAEYLSESPTPPGLFTYQFECLARNRLGYDAGMQAIAADPSYDDDWRTWIRQTRLRLGSVDFCDLIYLRSQHHVDQRRRLYRQERYVPEAPVLFGASEGRIAWANRGRDPLFMFGALQRQLGYPMVPRSRSRSDESGLPPQLEQRLQQLEKKVNLLESEQSGGIDLREFYAKPPEFPPDPDEAGPS